MVFQTALNKASPTLRGATNPDTEDSNIISHYSWMISLLPYMGHSKTYDAFDLNRSWMEKPNIDPAWTSVPEFLNPL